jgi:hypothetical protein
MRVPVHKLQKETRLADRPKVNQFFTEGTAGMMPSSDTGFSGLIHQSEVLAGLS